MQRLQLKLFGSFGGRLSSGRAVSLPTKKSQALLAYLAFRPGQAHSREKLASLLWGDAGEAQARQSLRQALSALRKVLAKKSCLIVEGENIALNESGVAVDVARFERLAGSAEPAGLEEAASLYAGDLLDGFNGIAEPFDTWLRAEREQLRELVLQVLGRLLTHQTERQDFDKGVQTAIRILTLDPLQEAVHRRLMCLYLAQGRRAAALRQYEICSNLLQRELGISPEPETKRIHQDLLLAAIPEPAGTLDGARVEAPSKTPLIGRVSERVRLCQGLRKAVAGNGGVVLISGNAGVGKSRLLEEAMSEAARCGFRRLVGRCYETEQILPFGPWVSALRDSGIASDVAVLEGLQPAWRSELARLTPEVADAVSVRSVEHHDYLRLFDAVLQVIAHLSRSEPICVALEDVHWADAMSLSLFCFVSRRILRRRVVLIATMREEVVSEAATLRLALEELRALPAFDHLAIGSLTEGDTLRLVHALAQTQTGPGIKIAPLGPQIWTTTKGNPFMVVETIRALQESPPLAKCHSLPLPVRVQELISNRIIRLREREQQVVAVAAVVGREFDFELLQRAAHLNSGEAAIALEELVRRGILRGAGETFDFSHDQIREVAYRRLTQPLQREMHRQVALALETHHAIGPDSQLSALALHFEKAHVWRKAAQYFRLAGVQAFRRWANRDAVRFFERSLSSLARLPENSDVLALAIDIRIDLRNALWPLGELQAVLQNLQSAEGAARKLDDPLRLGWASAYFGFHLWLAGDPAQGREFGDRACSLAEKLENFGLGILGNLCVGMADHALGNFRQAEDRFAEIIRLLPGDRARERFGAAGIPAAQAHTWLAWCLAERGEFDAVITHGQEAVRVAEASDHPWGLVVACWGLGLLHITRGEYQEALPVLERGLALSREWRFTLWEPLLNWLLGYAYAFSGRLKDGISLLSAAVHAIEERGLRLFQPLAIVHLAEAKELAGQSDDAAAMLQSALVLTRDRRERPCEARALRLLAEIGAASDPVDFEASRQHFDKALAIATDLGMRPLVAQCQHGLGALCGRSRRVNPAGK